MRGKLYGFLGGVGLAIIALALMAPTGGIPSRPLFQSVTIGSGTRASNQEVRINTSDVFGYRVVGPRPVLKLDETGQPANSGLWYVEADTALFRIRAVDDAEATATNPVVIARSGATATDISLTGRTIHESGATGQVAQFNNTHASGPYFSFSRSGTPFGDIGNGPQIGGGAALDDLAIGTRGAGDFVVATGASITERLRITDTGGIQVGGVASQEVFYADGAGSGGALGFARARTNSTGTVLGSRGVSSVTDVTGTGVWDVNFTAGVFDSTPTCSCITTAAGQCAQVGTASSSTVRFETRNATGTLTDLGMNVICMH